MSPPLLIPDLSALERKLSAPSPLLGTCYARFRQRLAQDAAYRSYNIFLPALLGEADAVAEGKALILSRVRDPRRLVVLPRRQSGEQDILDHHIWCVAPHAMRLAVYSTWLDRHGAWTPDERRIVGAGLLDFFQGYVLPVLRSRIPGGHNQQLSMTLACSVAGHAFADVDGVFDRARALRDWAFPKLRQTLGLMPASGYSGEGETYQSDVVAPLVMWTGVFLEQLGERDVWHRAWAPSGWRMSDTMRMEALLAGRGNLLPPWDNYGWQRVHNLAVRTLWAGVSGDREPLAQSHTIWDEPHHMAWCPDDRMWTLLYWPEERGAEVSGVREQEAGGGGWTPPRHPTPDTVHSPCLSGWSVPAVGAAIEHLPRRLRVISAWDRCSGSAQGVGREQVNPNHLTVDLAGEPITADGHAYKGEYLFSASARERMLNALSPVEREMIARQYGSVERWCLAVQYGLLGASCSIIVDGAEGYFPRWAREGNLLFEQREAERHTFAGEAAAFYQPAFDVTRMRRTVSVGASGVVWVVDDVAADSVHDFTWRLWLRPGARAAGPREVRLDLPSGAAVTLAWMAESDRTGTDCRVSIADESIFPAGWQSAAWPAPGSSRCDLTLAGRRVRFVTCLVPVGVDGLTVRAAGEDVWEAAWTGGADRFELPREIAALPDPQPVRGAQITVPETFCDLDEEPFGLPQDSDEVLLAALDQPPVEAWRQTGAAMQALVVRGDTAALPKIAALLDDARQNYTVHSVAAWCLGRARYAPALDLLRRFTHIPEVNTASRARWAVERIAEAVK